jgi:predicted phage terminase large subunit-like protein
MIEIKPQPKQEQFLSTSADVAIYGGAAGAGKTFAILLEAIRHIENENFGAVIFRRTSTQVTTEGGLWDETNKLYPQLGATSRQIPRYEWIFPEGSKINFAHLQHEKNLSDWQSSQIPLIIFDELTHFTERQFWYMFSRNRSTCGVKPYIRATCNPDPDSFVKKLISWYIDERTGYAIPERSGVIRWFVRLNGEIKWGDSKEDLLKKYPEELPKSFTFICADIFDNQELLKKDPGYLANLKALPLVEREQLLKGNWNIRPASGLYFKREYFEVVDIIPSSLKECRGWDFAATDKIQNDQANYTAGGKIIKDKDGYYYITDLFFDQISPAKVERAVLNMASQDGKKCTIRIPQDPGQAGKAQVHNYAKLLAGYKLKYRTMTGDKITRAGAFSSACENGLIRVLKALWNDIFFNNVESFPPVKGSPDIIDALVEAFDEICQGPTFSYA